MNQIIDINNVDTYPIDFINFINNNKEVLYNSFKDGIVLIDYESDLYDIIDKYFNKCFFKCIHASRVYDINNIYQYGIMIPSNSKQIIDIILEPIKEQIIDNYNNIYEIMNKIIKDRKYKLIHFIIGDISDITIENGFWMLDKYGGELLEDCFGMYDKYNYNKISKTGVPCAVLFKLEKNKINKNVLSEIYAIMLTKLLYNNKKHCFKKAYVCNNILPDSIIEVRELDSYE